MQDKIEATKELKRYLLPSKGPIIGGAFMLLIGFVMAVGAASYGVWVCCFFLASVTAGPCIMNICNLLSQIDNLEKQGILEEVILDFNISILALNGRLRLGENYVFGKHTGTLVEYKDIKRIYQHIHKTNFVEDKRLLKIEVPSSKDRILCKLPLKGKADDEVTKICVFITSKNPLIEIGYQRKK